MHRTLCVVIASGLLWGCGSQPPRQTSPAPSRSESTARTPSPTAAIRSPGKAIARLAESMIGTPYRYGGDHPNEGFDCSGLVYYTHGKMGVAVPRVSRDQYKRARKIPVSAAKPGDILFFSDAVKLSHIAIYIGNGHFVHAPSSGKNVSLGELNAPYYQKHLVGVGRLY
jgi:cell wall-associated NlpC family hydrolase